jgi:hypothetical protein
MTTSETEAFATRISAEEPERIRDGLEQTDFSRSNLLARGFRYYVAENPAGIPAFRSNEQDLGPLTRLNILEPRKEQEWAGTEDR